MATSKASAVSAKRILHTLFSIDLRALAAFRVGLGLVVLNDCFFRAMYAADHYSDWGLWPRSAAMKFTSPWDISIYFLNGRVAFQYLFLVLTAAFALALIFGYRTKLMTFLTWFMVISVQTRNFMVLTSGDDLLRLLLFWGMFLPLGATYSIDRALDKSATKVSSKIISAACVGLLVQAVLVYIFVALHKTGPEWRSEGSAVYYALRLEQMRSLIGYLLLKLPYGFLQFLTFATVIYQFVGSALLFSPFYNNVCRLFAAVGFIFLQIGFGACLNLGLFPWISIVSMIPFLPGPFWDGLGEIFEKREPIKIYFDADCAFCEKAVSVLRQFLLIPEEQVLPARSGSKERKLLEKKNSWIVLDEAGKSHFGYDGFITVLGHSRIFHWLAPILNLKILRLIGEWKYRWIANHRSFLSRLAVFPEKLNIKPRGGLLLLVFCTFILFDIIKINLGSLDPKFKMNIGLGPVEHILRVDQHWDMFSPRPSRDVGWYVMPGKLVDGTEVDVYSRKEGVDWTKPPVVANMYSNNRWQKYMMNLRLSKHESTRVYFAQYLCRRWNDGVTDPSKKLKSLDIFFMTSTLLLNFEETPTVKMKLWSQDCSK